MMGSQWCKGSSGSLSLQSASRMLSISTICCLLESPWAAFWAVRVCHWRKLEGRRDRSPGGPSTAGREPPAGCFRSFLNQPKLGKLFSVSLDSKPHCLSDYLLLIMIAANLQTPILFAGLPEWIEHQIAIQAFCCVRQHQKSICFRLLLFFSFSQLIHPCLGLWSA